MGTTTLNERRLQSVENAIRQLREKIEERERQRHRFRDPGHADIHQDGQSEDESQRAAA
jgi:hypothetical protein